MKKRVTALILAMCMLLSGFIVSAQQEEQFDSSQVFSPADFAEFAAAKNGGIMPITDSLTLDDVCESILDFNTEISVYELGIVSDPKGYNASCLHSTLIQNYPELFILQTYRYTVSSDGYIDKIYPYYYYSIDECKRKLEEFNGILDDILKDLPDNSTDLEKVMFIHDYLVLNGRYDYGISDAYGFLTEGYGVCQGYALAFCALARRAGLNCIQAESDKQNHIWNLVEVDGEYYHIDVTWDDPVNDRLGRVSYEHFLKSTNKIIEVAVDKQTGAKREDWLIVGEVAVECNSEKYDSGYAWDGDKWPFVKLGDEWYGIKYSEERHITLNKISNDFTTVSEVFDLGGDIRWYVNGSSGSFYNDVYSGFYSLGNALFFNTSNSLECIYFENGSIKTKSIDISKLTGETDLNIYGSYYDKTEGQIILQYQTSPNGTAHYYAVDIPHLSDLDASCAQLLVKVRRFLLGNGKLDSAELFDVNGDGEISIIDLVRMKKRSAYK